MKVALLAAMVAASLAGHAQAADPSPELVLVSTPSFAHGAIPSVVATSASERQEVPATDGRHGARSRSNAIRAIFGAEPETTICDKARAFCDQGKVYWCNYEDQHCSGGRL